MRAPMLVSVLFVCMHELKCESKEQKGDSMSESKGVVCASEFVCRV